MCTRLALAGALALLWSACAAPAPVPVTPTALPTATAALAPTVTPVPPTRVPTRVATAVPTPAPTVTPTAIPRLSLQNALNAALAQHGGGTVGVVVTDLRTGETFSANADHTTFSASLYKLFVMVTAYQAIADGTLDPAEQLTLTPAIAASDPISDLQVGTRVSVDCALQTMVRMSGNSASDLLMRRLGQATVTSQLRAMGLTHSGFTSDGAMTSASDIARLLEALARKQVVSAEASQRMVDLLGGQQQNDRIPAPLPLSARVAHKTGELDDLRHDAAIVTTPTTTYLVVAMVEGVPVYEARSTIVDVSRAAYVALEGAPTTYRGLPPRIATQTFRVPDTQGRMLLLGDPRTETAPLPAEVQRAEGVTSELRLRPEAVGDLVGLQRAASDAGLPFWIDSAFAQPTDAEAPTALPTAWLQPCALEQPERAPDRKVDRTAAPGLQQAWLGTVVGLTDRQASGPSDLDDRATPVGQWLAQHAADSGFIPALPETTEGTRAGHERWTWRWVGREMAQRIRTREATDGAAGALDELRRAEAELKAMDPGRDALPAWDLQGACWTIATNSGRGCPSRWYFLELPL
jgi:beta-lactamase class A